MEPEVPANAPAACPGTASGVAGAAAPCAGCPNQSACSAARQAGPDPAPGQVFQRLAQVRAKVLVMSGKGGVGKSTLTAALARHLASDSHTQVGVLDVDICGPSLPRILGVPHEEVHDSGEGWSPIVADENLYLMSIGFLLSSPDDAVVWRGPRKNGIIKQFLTNVDWGALDYLLVDTPPGTSDEHLSVTQLLSQAGVDGVILVTTPQEVSLLDVRKQITFCKKMKLGIVGVVENMSHFKCPNCEKDNAIFPRSSGGAVGMCQEMGVPFLGSLPLDPAVGKACDYGQALDSNPEVASTIHSICNTLRSSFQDPFTPN